MKEIKSANRFIFWLLVYEVSLKIIFEFIKLNIRFMFLSQMIFIFMFVVFYFLITK